MTKKHILYEVFFFIAIITLTILLLFIKNSLFASILFTLFYVLLYVLRINNLISMVSIILLCLIFDSLNNIDLGVSAIVILTVALLYKIELMVIKYSNTFTVQYLLSMINFGVLILLIKGLSIFFQISFIHGGLFYLISILGILCSKLIIGLLTKINN